MTSAPHTAVKTGRILALLLLCILLSITSLTYAQETTDPEPAPETTAEPVSIITEPPAPTLTFTPTATETATATSTLPPIADATAEPTLPTEAATEVTAEASAEAPAEVTVEPQFSPTPAFVTATPDGSVLPPQEATETVVENRARSVKVDVGLLALEDQVLTGNARAASASAAAMGLDVDSSGQRIHIEVIASDAAEAARLRPIIESFGGVFIIGYEQRMEFYFPITALSALERTTGQFIVHKPEEGRAALGSFMSEGVSATGASIWHTRGLNGAGVKIGVIDTGFTGYRNRDTAGCVQSAVSFTPGGMLENGDDHGTNVAEIICDMAPRAQVYLAQAYTLSGLSAAVDYLLSQNVQVINMSMRWDQNGAGDGTGEANAIVQRAIDRGVVWVNAAGNSNGDSWHGAYANITDPAVNITGDYHDFGPASINFLDFDGSNVNLQLANGAVNPLFGGWRFDCPDNSSVLVHLLLRWSDWNASRTGNASGQDYDVYIVRTTDNGATWVSAGAFSLSDQTSTNLYKPMEEVATYAACDDPNTRFGFVINNWSATGTEYLHAVTWMSGPLALATPGVSISTPADSAGVLSVAAGGVQPHVQFDGSGYVNGWPFSASGYPDVEVYSSHGPILGPGGTNPSGAAYVKPDVTAPTNVTTSRGRGFNGTSAASPHAAGFVALVYQYNRGYYDSLAPNTRAGVIINDIEIFFTRPPESDVREPYCEGVTAVYCFGAGVLVTEPPAYMWTDTRLEENNTAIILSGPGWGSVSNTLASGRLYAQSTDNYAQIAFRTAYANEITIGYWQLPGASFAGTAEIYRNGVMVQAINMGAPTATLATVTIPTSGYSAVDQFVIRPTGGIGLTLDYVQIGHPDTLQEDNPALNFFGSWRRTALVGASGGFHTVTTSERSGVSFYSDSSQFSVTYAGTPTGGIIDIFVNGQRCYGCGEIDTYGGDTRLTRPQEVALITIPVSEFGAGPYVVELVASGRINPSSRGIGISIDNIRFPTGYNAVTGAQLEAETSVNLGLTLDGSWRNTRSALASGSFYWATTTPGAEYRFMASGSQLVIYFTALNTGGLVDIYVNGVRCAECGQIDMYAPAAMYRTPHSFMIPGSYGPGPYAIKLVNTGNRHPSSRGTSFSVDRVDVLDATSFDPLALHNVRGDANGLFWINSGWIMQRQTEAIGSDVYINSAANREVYFNTCSQDFTLLTGVGRDGGLLKVYGSKDASAEVLLAEFNANSTSTLWRYALDVRVPNTAPFDTPCDDLSPYAIRIEVQSWTQNGRPLRYGYLDALLINDSGPLFNWTTSIGEAIYYNSPGGKLVEVGAGWTNASELTFPFGLSFAANNLSSVRRTNIAGASLQFTIEDESIPLLFYHRTPDGGIAEVWVNGKLAQEIDFYSPVPYNGQQVMLTIPANTLFPATIEIRNTGRRTRGATGSYMTIDALIAEGTNTFIAPLVGTGHQQTDLQLFGATWTTSTATPTRTIDPSGSTQATTTQFSGGARFILTGTNRFMYVTSMSATHGVAEVWINGRVCSSCGNLISFARATFWRSSFLIEIPIGEFGVDPYYVEIRSTNLRPTGGSGYALSVDEIVPLDGGVLHGPGDTLFTDTITSAPDNPLFFGTWTTVNNAMALHGSFLRTTETFDPEGFPAPERGIYQFTTTSDEVIVLRNMGVSGGMARIYIVDISGPTLLCHECGTMDSYSSYARNQVPFYFRIPDRFTPVGGQYTILIVNTPQRAATSRGNVLEIDGFIFP